MQLQTIFKRLGYPKHTDAIYDTLCKSSESLSVTTIALRASVSRMVVYRCLTQLQQGGLVQQHAKGRRTVYSAESPRKLNTAMSMVEAASTTTIERYAKEREKDVPQSVRFLYGQSGIRTAFDDVITHTTKGDTFYRYTSERDLARVNQYLARDYRDRRDKKKLERLVISNPVSGRQKKSRLERFIKFFPPEADQFEQNIIQLVYGERVSIIDLNTEQVVIIENKQLADFQKVIFKMLYRKL
jgi:predicted transcriptional regulator